MHTVVETPAYLAVAEALFSESERRAIIDQLADNPLCGVALVGTHGVRKVRFGFGGRGKSGGARIVYLFSGDGLPVFLLTAFAKNEKDNLSAAERNALGATVGTMIASYRKQRTEP